MVLFDYCGLIDKKCNQHYPFIKKEGVYLKKVFALIIILCIIPLFVFSEPFKVEKASDINISEMPFDELVRLEKQILTFMWISEEWQSVNVPQGDYNVGIEIPVGSWKVKCADVDHSNPFMSMCSISWGFDDKMNSVNLYNPYHDEYSKGQITELRIDLEEGMKVSIMTSFAPVNFSPFDGSFNFMFNK